MTLPTKYLTLAEVIDILDERDENNVEDIFIEPPEVREMTDEDSDEEEGGNINSLSRNQLLAPAQIRESRQDVSTLIIQSKSSKKARKEDNLWTDGGKTLPQNAFPVVITSDLGDMSAVQYFENFFNDELMDMIIVRSTEYCLSKNLPDIKLTRDDLRVFFAILIVSGYNKLPGKSMYWSSSNDKRNVAIYEAMRRDRFDNIMRSLHFQSNTNLDKTDKFAKLRPLISHIQKKCMENYKPSPSISHDEAMVEYFGKHGCKQAIRNKSIRFGYKIWCQNSPSGYLIAFDPYQGKTFKGDEEREKSFGKCASTVLHLLDQYPLSKSEFPYHIFCDNLFTSFSLLAELKSRGYNCTGTTRANRLGNNSCLSSIQEFEKKNRGHQQVATVTFNNNHLFVTRWKDNSVVTVTSTCLAADPEGSVKRWSKSELKHVLISIPHAIQNYNQNMGGTDRMDQNVNAYSISIRGKKWWWSVFTWLLDVSVQNAWLLARSNSTSKMTQLSFRTDLAMSYLLQYKNLPKTAGRKPNKLPGFSDARLDNVGHLVQKTYNNKQRRCAGKNCKSTVRTECMKCNVGLCITCFVPYHTE